MKTYTATRAGGERVVTVLDGNTARSLAHIPLHSPDGFEWGYGGSGPADLALAILADVLNEQPTREQVNRGSPIAVQLHNTFLRDVVRGLGKSGFSLTEDFVWKWLGSYGVEKGKNRPTRDELQARR